MVQVVPIVDYKIEVEDKIDYNLIVKNNIKYALITTSEEKTSNRLEKFSYIDIWELK